MWDYLHSCDGILAACDFAIVDCSRVKMASFLPAMALTQSWNQTCILCLIMAGSCSCTTVDYCSCDICVHTLIMRSVLCLLFTKFDRRIDCFECLCCTVCLLIYVFLKLFWIFQRLCVTAPVLHIQLFVVIIVTNIRMENKMHYAFFTGTKIF